MTVWLRLWTTIFVGIVGAIGALEYAAGEYMASIAASVIAIFLIAYLQPLTQRQTEQETGREATQSSIVAGEQIQQGEATGNEPATPQEPGA